MNIKKKQTSFNNQWLPETMEGRACLQGVSICWGGDDRTVLSCDCGYLIVCVCQLFLELYTTCKFYLNKPEFKKLHMCLFYFQMHSVCSSLIFIYS